MSNRAELMCYRDTFAQNALIRPENAPIPARHHYRNVLTSAHKSNHQSGKKPNKICIKNHL